jgi:hypothetical protein
MSAEIAAGGLTFAANPSIVIEQQDVLITPDRITLTYALRNNASTPQAIHIAFALPDLDANAISDAEVALPAAEPANFIQFSTTVDGQPIAVKVEQRTLAIGLDVTALLMANGLAVFPFMDNMAVKLEALAPAPRLELLERGVLKEDGTAVAPAWTLKSTAHWRQNFEPQQTLTIVHTYRPIAGVASYSSEAVQPFRKRACVNAAQESAIAKLPAEGGVAPTLTSVGYGSTPAADALGPARKFRLIVETKDPITIVATCREGLKRTSPMQLDWSANDYVLDEELQVLFAR